MHQRQMWQRVCSISVQQTRRSAQQKSPAFVSRKGKQIRKANFTARIRLHHTLEQEILTDLQHAQLISCRRGHVDSLHHRACRHPASAQSPADDNCVAKCCSQADCREQSVWDAVTRAAAAAAANCPGRVQHRHRPPAVDASYFSSGVCHRHLTSTSHGIAAAMSAHTSVQHRRSRPTRPAALPVAAVFVARWSAPVATSAGIIYTTVAGRTAVTLANDSTGATPTYHRCFVVGSRGTPAVSADRSQSTAAAALVSLSLYLPCRLP